MFLKRIYSGWKTEMEAARDMVFHSWHQYETALENAGKIFPSCFNFNISF